MIKLVNARDGILSSTDDWSNRKLADLRTFPAFSKICVNLDWLSEAIWREVFSGVILYCPALEIWSKLLKSLAKLDEKIGQKLYLKEVFVAIEVGLISPV